ncbi:MAG: D-tyrosyl-tRNA(Tyr) deacylase [Candidatus Marinimicrobia bacterium]|jgi:D-tyrosyl-tRNA(Tyr) deacylase|nr:D-tyrosyl-tRNA(Tyr) deacylase [Candidatus Neomarinimicrobiota bacterium]MBT3633044.1 D-tyrosyl-tRNA(Tyr) deacylase [Candidatus Neomarinimicrobiota bacterium]MBT3683514.1 D-tyrosyl-tRNA(Tyr) deacylase [Candidatus Neomarinimicrobiota bacterium]MBT3758644.1 D-tyrosyl-tRNA(Tyr) deacylase [Candidatus Neomarinimicrobiota bacterium]MBT3896447.1 D-tyrosyl-tRNA(Tyr) deacylase [Candidatus Neomarinimicrobiota bacterium]
MIAAIQRVSGAHVEVDNEVVGKISNGFLILLGVFKDDDESDAKFLADKISVLRVFQDENKNMNLSLQDVDGSVLVVSQFTLCGDWRKGRRPGFQKAARPEEANRLYCYFSNLIKQKSIPVETGVFGAMMNVTLTNEGPVTFVMDSKEK